MILQPGNWKPIFDPALFPDHPEDWAVFFSSKATPLEQSNNTFLIVNFFFYEMDFRVFPDHSLFSDRVTFAVRVLRNQRITPVYAALEQLWGRKVLDWEDYKARLLRAEAERGRSESKEKSASADDEIQGG